MVRYAEIAEHLRAEITAGRLQPGDPIPTERELQDKHGVSPATARQAIRSLRDEGLIETQRGRGSSVRIQYDPIRMMKLYLRGPGLREMEWEDHLGATSIIPAPECIARRLAIPVGEGVTRVAHSWRMDGDLLAVSTQWEPIRYTHGTVIEVPGAGEDVIARFDSIGVRVTRVRSQTRARMPSPGERRVLRIPAGVTVPVLEVKRTHYAGDRRVETADLIIRADRVVSVDDQDVP